jgi:TonB-linked SusC/RagA family outer membrane protein
MKQLLYKKLYWVFMLFSLGVFAQEKSISGTITDQSDGSILPGVSIQIKGTQVGTTSGSDGKYKVNVPKNAKTLTISFIGFESVEIEIGNQSTIDVKMNNDVKQLSEVVVTAFGIEREKKGLAYSTQLVKNEQLVKAAQPNLTNALQGKVAGVIVRQSSGMPGASSFITIRGSRSFTGNNQPLFVIDGIPISSGPDVNVPSVGGVSGTDQSSRSLDINPDDVESVNILKGPAASALYGLRASNGVVVITTKRGKNAARNKVNVNLTTNYTADKVTRIPQLQGTYAQGDVGVFSQGTSTSWGPKISTLQPYDLAPGGIAASVLNTKQTPQVYDNISPLFQTGGTTSTNLDISGANDNGNYAVSGAYINQTGIIPTTGMQRINFKVAGDYKLSNKLKLAVSANYSDISLDKLPGGSDLSNPLFTTYYAPRTYDLWNIPYAFPDNEYRQIHYRGAMDNPRWALKYNSFGEDTKRIFVM